MKNALILLFCLASLEAFATPMKVQVISADYGVEDMNQRKSLCLTVIELPLSGEIIGVVESIEDCFYARAARHSLDQTISIELNQLKPIDLPALRDHLQMLDSQLEFYFSEGE